MFALGRPATNTANVGIRLAHRSRATSGPVGTPLAHGGADSVKVPVSLGYFKPYLAHPWRTLALLAPLSVPNARGSIEPRVGTAL